MDTGLKATLLLIALVGYVMGCLRPFYQPPAVKTSWEHWVMAIICLALGLRVFQLLWQMAGM